MTEFEGSSYRKQAKKLVRRIWVTHKDDKAGGGGLLIYKSYPKGSLEVK